MKMILPVVLAAVFALPAVGDDDVVLPWGGPFVNEEDFPRDGDPSEYFWVELALVDGDGRITIKGGGQGPIKQVCFDAMEGDVNRVLLYRGKDSTRRYTVYSKRVVRILDESGGHVQISQDRDNLYWRMAFKKIEYKPDGEDVQKTNLDYIRREVPVEAFSWVDPDLDVGKSEVTMRKLRRERRAKDDEERRAEYERQREREEAERKIRDRENRERDQLARVEKYKKEFDEGNAKSGLMVSFYYAAYSAKLSSNGRGVEAARTAAEAFKWLRKAADAGFPRAQQSLAWHLLNGGGGDHPGGFFWSGPMPDVPKDNAYVSPAAFQGTDVPADVLLSETNGVKTYYRVYSRDPVEGVRLMQIADKAGDPWAGMWIRDHKSNKCNLSMPKWFLAKDGFSVEGKEAVEFEEVAIRPCFLASIVRKIGKDAEGNVVSVSDEYAKRPDVIERYGCPWHEASAKCVITEVLP